MFSSSAQYYDAIYSFKDYRAEAERLRAVVDVHLRSGGDRLLDVACGTGLHLQYLREHYQVEGLDLDEALLEIARRRNPGVLFTAGDMVDIDLGRRFDVVTCLFSSIGYVKTLSNLARAAGCLARHLVPGGVLAVEPWFTPETWRPGTVHVLLREEPQLKIARMNTSFVDGRLSYFDLHYLIGTPAGTEHLVERHELGLFTREEMTGALEGAGLEVVYDAEGLMGRGLYLGLKPLQPAGLGRVAMLDPRQLDIPDRFETERLIMRSYRPGDGPWFYAMSQRNRAHLARYEPDNVVMQVADEAEAEAVVCELASDWAERRCFFLAAFDKASGGFVAQIYAGPVDWGLPEFQIGYFADRDHVGQGYVTEAARAALRFLFEHLKAHRVSLECDDTNLHSAGVAERCGMIREGHIRQNKRHPDGTLTGTLRYGLLRDEFRGDGAGQVLCGG